MHRKYLFACFKSKTKKKHLTVTVLEKRLNITHIMNIYIYNLSQTIVQLFQTLHEQCATVTCAEVTCTWLTV